jgi:hypothetical protein
MVTPISPRLPRGMTGPFFENGLLKFVENADGEIRIQSVITGMTYDATLDRTSCSISAGR